MAIRPGARAAAGGLLAAGLLLAAAGCSGDDGGASPRDGGTTSAPEITNPRLTPPTVSATVAPANADFCGKMAALIGRVVTPNEGESDYRGPWLEVAKASPDVLRTDMESAVSDQPGVDVESSVARIDKWLKGNCGFTIAESTGSTPMTEAPAGPTTTTAAVAGPTVPTTAAP